jgi:hypothetical protein
MRQQAHLGAGVPSSISRDLTTVSTAPRRITKTSTITSPIIETSDGVLSKVYGSLVEPESQRQQWACHGCNQVFHRDATIYVAPSAHTSAGPLAPSSAVNREQLLKGESQEHYCRSCYSDRFSMGSCLSCNKAVLGSTKEDGKYVKASSGDIWHGRCWKCVDCGESGAEKVSLGMAGLPTCEDCFDKTASQRKHVVRQASPGRRGRRISPTSAASALSGSASRSGMGATIAELSKKFGKPVPASPTKQSPVLDSMPASPELRSHSRSNSISGSTRIRPLTAQFSGQGFNLAAFQPSTPTLTRSDSRSRSVSPHKSNRASGPTCAKCLQGPFDGPGSKALEATMISIPREDRHYHPECFLCGICDKSMGDSTRSFVRLGEASYAHPQCAPPEPASRKSNTAMSAPLARTSSSTTLADHATHQRETMPSISNDVKLPTLPSSYLTTSTDDTTTTSPMSRRFQSSAGAAPPTRSSLVHQRPSGQTSSGALSNVAVSSNARIQADKFSKLGGMNTCGGCSLTVSSLEGIPGPRGIRWHKKCLVCSSKSRGTKICGKSLDSSARVDEQGQVRCRQCFDAEHSRHSIAMH